MVLSDEAHAFVTDNHFGVLTTFRKDGAAQMSLVNCGYYKGSVAFTTTQYSAKLSNLKRNPRCSLLVARSDWRLYVVLEGYTKVLSTDNTDAEELRGAFRDIYRAAGGGDHPDWKEYDQAMLDDRRAIVIVLPEHVYGTGVA